MFGQFSSNEGLAHPGAATEVIPMDQFEKAGYGNTDNEALCNAKEKEPLLNVYPTCP